MMLGVHSSQQLKRILVHVQSTKVGRQNKRLRIHTSNPLILKVRRARKQNKDHSKKHLPGIVLPILKLATIRTGKALDQRAPVNKNTRLIPNRQLILADGPVI